MAKPGRPSPVLDDYLYWQERLAGRDASGLSIDEFCVDEGVSRSTFYRWVRRLKVGIPEAVKEEGASLTLAACLSMPVSVPPGRQNRKTEIGLAVRWPPRNGL